MDNLTNRLRKQAPWSMMFADNIVLCSKNRHEFESDLERWRHALERWGMKIIRSKTEYLWVNEQGGNDHIKLEGSEIKNIDNLSTWGSTLDREGSSNTEIRK
jgi:hypothetical protein